MATLLLRLLLTPTLICLASLAGRRWGPLVSGWLVGLPFTSGPVALVLALSHGGAFATTDALGTLAGTLSQVGFCLAYAWLARRGYWLGAFVAGCFAFACATLLLQRVSLPGIPLFLLVCGVLAAALFLLRRPTKRALSMSCEARTLPMNGDVDSRAWSWWDLPLRMLVATSVVLALTAAAPALGARLTGLLAPFPVFATILAMFAHRTDGAEAAVAVLRGLLLGLFAFSSFFIALALLLTVVGTVGAFAVACAAALLVQGATLWRTRRSGVSAPVGEVNSPKENA